MLKTHLIHTAGTTAITYTVTEAFLSYVMSPYSYKHTYTAVGFDDFLKNTSANGEGKSRTEWWKAALYPKPKPSNDIQNILRFKRS